MYIHTYKPLHHTPSRPAAEAKSLTPETVRRGYQTTQGLHRIGHHLHDCVVRDIVHFTPGSSRTLSGSNPRCGSQSMQPGREAVKSRQSRDHWVLDTISGSRIETSAQLASPSGGRKRGTRYWGGALCCDVKERKERPGSLHLVSSCSGYVDTPPVVSGSPVLSFRQETSSARLQPPFLPEGVSLPTRTGERGAETVACHRVSARIPVPEGPLRSLLRGLGPPPSS